MIFYALFIWLLQTFKCFYAALKLFFFSQLASVITDLTHFSNKLVYQKLLKHFCFNLNQIKHCYLENLN